MKRLSLLLTVIFLISSVTSFQQVSAQEKTKEEQEKEIKIQQAIDQQKKALIEQKKAQTEAEAVITDQKAATEDVMKEVQVNVESTGRAGSSVRMYSPRGGGSRAFSMDQPFEFSAPNMEFFSGHAMGDSERTTWDFSKSVKENTFSKDYAFDVEKTVKNVVMSVMCDCKAGEIHIEIVMPGGKEYSDHLIDEGGNLNVRKSFSITETENQDKTGEWKFKISSTKATGFFKISLQTY